MLFRQLFDKEMMAAVPENKNCVQKLDTADAT